MAKNENIDVFSILTPSGAHAKVIIDLVQYEKHFVVEKPLTLRLSDADEIIESCDMIGCKLFVVQQNRFNPPVVKLKEALDAGRFGKIVLATVRVRWCRRQEYYDQKKWRGTWSFDGGVLANQASHHVDMFLHNRSAPDQCKFYFILHLALP
jgi:predicted dehydrogenase